MLAEIGLEPQRNLVDKVAPPPVLPMNVDENTQISRFQARARNYVSRGNYSGAETYLLAALRSARLRAPDRLSLWNDLGMVYKYLGKFDKARELRILSASIQDEATGIRLVASERCVDSE